MGLDAFENYRHTVMHIDILTIFPGMFSEVLNTSIVQRAQACGAVRIAVHDLRRFTHDKRRSVDDRPYGGGPGMVLRPEPIFEAVDAIRKTKPWREATRGKRGASRATRSKRAVILLAPSGEPLTQGLARALSGYDALLLVCGHYEGVDERVRQALVDREISIGDYVVTGGELPAMVVIDAVTRLLPGVLGDPDSTVEDSFSEGNDGRLEYPQYTRPPVYRGLAVPDILRSGDHGDVAAWRAQASIARTSERRPDLVKPRRTEPQRRTSGG